MPATVGVAVVTGATSPVGSAVVQALLGAGFAVGLFDRSETSLDAAVRALDATGAPIVGRRLEVDDQVEVADAIADIVAWRGRLDVLVHCADGDSLAVATPTLGDQPFLKSLDACFAAAVEIMRSQRRGRLVAVAPPLRAAVDDSITRGTLRAYVEALALKVASDGLAVNAVLPGWIDPGPTGQTTGPTRTQLRSIPLKRRGSVEEVAAAALFLASSKSGYITGESLRVGGGLRA